ncbi:DinB family protein [Terrimonas pollutisoli]|uniref:DinB family protein n=1 Tax=Terrimonas pollutisoli TaxID=3034147 RepID=UPI0023ED113A|nr:DinB family protein [Terrimonas sp. H1YJ31]
MIQDVIDRIECELIIAFEDLDYWFGSHDSELHYLPSNGGWTIRQILGHISLTNHFLLILVRKGTLKSIEIASNTEYKNLLVSYDLDWEKLKLIGEHKSFEWNRPQHMEPTNKISLIEVKQKLIDQKEECLSLLNQVSNGEGVLYKTMMSVNNLGKIDVYHYLYFLVQHIRRHLIQMTKVKLEFDALKTEQ